MRWTHLVAGALALSLGACAQLPPRTLAADPGGVAGPTSVAGMDSRRDIVLAVANPLMPPPTRAGSTLFAYAPRPNYAAGQRAVSTLAALRRDYGWHEVAGWPITALDLYCIVLEPPPGTSREALLQALASDARVRLAEPLHDYSVYSLPDSAPRHYNDPYADLQRGFVATDAATAHELTQGGGVRVAVVDTGADVAHPDLRGRIGAVRNLVDDDRAAFAGDSHGTEVAGIIAATGNNGAGIVGIAPKATLDLYKACWYPAGAGTGARCNTFTLAKALAAILATKVRIINLSLGGPPDPLLASLLAQLLGEGRVVVTAMPPDGDVDGFPDSAPGVIVVRTSSATPAPPGVVSAPGRDILTTQPNGDYDFTSGSSMAAAHVSGIVALLLALAPELDADGLHRLLLRSSIESNGMLQVNAAAAVAALRSMPQAGAMAAPAM
ncbi:MAG TPA: S8 family serine peptidase [Rhodanobacteraceae bacterium]|nr:S8 family serine peptidase [Rhodanobacteraceae bacterium]